MNKKIDTWRDIQGWFDSPQLYASIIDRSSFSETTNILEIGTWLGKSTCYLGSFAKVWGKPVKIWAVDTFKGEETCSFQMSVVKENGGSILNKFCENVSALGLEDYITPIESESHKCLELIPVKFFDYIIIDANHAYDFIKRDIEYLWPSLIDSGVMTGHDFNGDVEKAVYEFAKEKKLNVYRSGSNWVIKK